METYIYIRVSTDIQDNSVEMQKERCEAYCKYNNFPVKEVIIDVNVSAKVKLFAREGGRILKKVKNARVVTLKLDRMFRSSFAELERNTISERTIAVLRSKKERGEKYNGTALFGFKWGENGMEESEEIEIVKAVIGMLKSGLSKTEIKRLHNFPNFKKIYQIIKREEYQGYWN